MQAAGEPILDRPFNPDDELHVQNEEYIASVSAAGERAAAVSSALLHVGVTPRVAPTRNFQRYFCRCTGQWLDRQHACPEAPPTQLPSGLPIRPGTELGPEWITHRIVVNNSIYPGGVLPAPGSAAAVMTSAVGGGLEALPAHWFLPVSAGTIAGGPPMELGGSSTVAGGDGGGPAEGEAKKDKKKKKNRWVRRKKKGGVTAVEDKGKGKGKEKDGGEEGGEEGGSGEVVTAA